MSSFHWGTLVTMREICKATIHLKMKSLHILLVKHMNLVTVKMEKMK